MIIDILLALVLLSSLTIGYKRGFLRTLFQTIGYLVGGVLGLYLALKFSHQWNLDLKRVGLLLASIIFGGITGSLLGRILAKGLRATIIKGPLAFMDSVAGAALELARSVIIAYLIATVILWSPWDAGKSAVSESKLFAKIEPLLPGVITQANTWVKNEFLNLRL